VRVFLEYAYSLTIEEQKFMNSLYVYFSKCSKVIRYGVSAHEK
jgi:hypothetical protein